MNSPDCNVPQEPSPVHIVAYGNDKWVIISQPDWALLGGYIYDLQRWVIAAGPCLKGHGSDAQTGTGVIGHAQGEP